MYKITILNLFLILSIMLGGCGGDEKLSNSQPPNILFIFCDDMNDIVIDDYMNSHNPNIDKLASMGTSFTNAHINAPLCAPSRASMLTGIGQVRVGILVVCSIIGGRIQI